MLAAMGVLQPTFPLSGIEFLKELLQEANLSFKGPLSKPFETGPGQLLDLELSLSRKKEHESLAH